MIAVALETSGHPSSIAISVDGTIHEEVLLGKRAHASDLLPALERLLQEAGASKNQIAHVFVGTGPGSYTGLRVGIATALGLARGTGARIHGVPSGETRSFGACEPGSDVTMLLDARQGELYLARYRRTDNDVETRLEPRVAQAAQGRELVPEADVILGDANTAKAASLDAQQSARVLVADDSGGYPAAAALLRLALGRLERGQLTSDEVPEPLYLRPFAAKPRKS